MKSSKQLYYLYLQISPRDFDKIQRFCTKSLEFWIRTYCSLISSLKVKNMANHFYHHCTNVSNGPLIFCVIPLRVKRTKSKRLLATFICCRISYDILAHYLNIEKHYCWCLLPYEKNANRINIETEKTHYQLLFVKKFNGIQY